MGSRRSRPVSAPEETSIIGWPPDVNTLSLLSWLGAGIALADHKHDAPPCSILTDHRGRTRIPVTHVAHTCLRIPPSQSCCDRHVWTADTADTAEPRQLTILTVPSFLMNCTCADTKLKAIKISTSTL
ncbi:MAG: hypothetical protein JWL97_4407 [Gemmatimonadales bacterium]|nr:hypothetical protein [Gemmatimonadales bacterium]